MVDKFNQLASEAGISQQQLHAVVGNLLDSASESDLSRPEFFNFDIAAIGLGFHHFEQRPLMLRRIAERLKPGGALLIVDFLVNETPGAEDLKEWNKHGQDTIAIAGFTEKDMQLLYDQAGLQNFGLKVLPEAITMEIGDQKKQKTLFFARGFKA